jgi:predicted ArsR family transcriptional regulator
MAEVVPAASGEPGATLRIHNCAMRGIAEQFPEACEVEAAYLARLVGAPVVRTAHRRDGCGRCVYGVGVEVGGTAAGGPVAGDPQGAARAAVNQEQA